MSRKRKLLVALLLVLAGVLLEDKVLDPFNGLFFGDRSWLPGAVFW